MDALAAGPHAHPTDGEEKETDCGSKAGLPGRDWIAVVDVVGATVEVVGVIVVEVGRLVELDSEPVVPQAHATSPEIKQRIAVCLSGANKCFTRLILAKFEKRF